jgi:small multidrug resistance family-3 protein
VERLLIIVGLFVAAGLCEIGGGYLVWGWTRDHKPLAWALMGALVLAAYGVVAALQPISEFGRVYAAYGGVFIALALTWASSLMGSAPTDGIYWARRSACWGYSSWWCRRGVSQNPRRRHPSPEPA